MSKPLVFPFTVILFAFAATSGAGSLSAQAAKAPTKSAELAVAKKLYARDCSMCHGDNGNGQTELATSMKLTLLDWSDPKSLADKSDQALFDMIRKGKDMMPPEDESRAKDDDVKGLIQYIRGFAGAPHPAAAPAGPAQ